MRKYLIYYFSLFLFIIGIIVSCTDEELNLSNSESSPTVRAAFDDYFDWDRVSAIPAKVPNISEIIEISLPWEQGSTQNIGIPESWLDPKAHNTNTSERFYSRENGWELVYSNMNQRTLSKYFALYNKYTGILRFFLYEITSSPGVGTSASFWGIALDKSSSLFNFTKPIANGANVPIYQPAVINSPEVSFSGTEASGTGYKSSNWYGIEVECAYDENINANNQINFKIKGWATNKITLSGTGTSSGTITGTIKTTPANSSGLNLRLDNMFNNNSSSTINNTNSNIANNLGDKIDEGISKGDSFFTTLWSGVKGKASKWISSGLEAGAKKGISAILTSGGSVVGEALGGLVNSLIGGKKQESISKVDLSLQYLTNISIEGEMPLTGWGSISPFPIPGSTSNPDNMPLYNKPLGVWNLKENPKVTADFYYATTWLPIGRYCQYNLKSANFEIILNPEIASKFNITNVTYNLVTSEYNMREYGVPGYPHAFMGETKYYSINATKLFYEDETTLPIPNILSERIMCRVSFNLVDKNDSNNVYLFSRYFNIKCVLGQTYTRNDVYPQEITPFF